MKPAAKTGLKIVIVIYVAVVTAFVVTARQRAEPLHKAALTDSVRQELNNIREAAHAEDPAHIRKRPINGDEAEQVLQNYLKKKGTVISINYTLAVQWLNFAILLLVLYGFFWDPLMKFLDQRRDSIRDEIRRAEDNRKKSEEILSQRKKKLAEVKQERATLIEQGKHEGQSERERIVSEAQQQAEQIVTEVRQKLDEEVRRARLSLQKEVAELATEIAQKLLRRELRADDHRNIIDEMVERLSSREVGESSPEKS